MRKLTKTEKRILWAAKKIQEGLFSRDPEADPISGDEPYIMYKDARASGPPPFDSEMFADRVHGGETDFSGKTLTLAIEGWMSRDILCNLNFSGAHFKERGDFRGLYVEDGIVRDTIFDNAILEKPEFYNTDVRGTSFRGATLIEASFLGCDLRKTDFTGAELQNVSWSGSNLFGAKMPKGWLNGVDDPSDLPDVIPDGRQIKDSRRKISFF